MVRSRQQRRGLREPPPCLCILPGPVGLRCESAAERYTGLRPGERLTEELLAADEGVRPTVNPAIMEVVSPASINQQDLDWTIERLAQLSREGRPDDLEKALKNAVRETTGRRQRAEEPSPSPKRTKHSEVSPSEAE